MGARPRPTTVFQTHLGYGGVEGRSEDDGVANRDRLSGERTFLRIADRGLRGRNNVCRFVDTSDLTMEYNSRISAVALVVFIAIVRFFMVKKKHEDATRR